MRIAFPEGLSSAEEVDLMEDAIRPMPSKGKALSIDLRPFEVKTIRFSTGRSPS